MREAYFIQSEAENVLQMRTKKRALSRAILKSEPLREIHPDLVKGRSRLDLMFYQQKLGIRGPSKSTDKSFDFFVIKNPESCTPLISQMIEEFLCSKSPLKMAQLRFRSNSRQQKGLWIDTSKAEQERILKESLWLSKLLHAHWIIEIGQKAQRVIFRAGTIKLCDTAPEESWLNSFDQNGQTIPLLSKISSFSQPGEQANKSILSAAQLLIQRNLKLHSSLKWVDWGAGYGNLSVFFASLLGPHGAAYENSKLSYQSLKNNLLNQSPQIKSFHQSAEKYEDWTDAAQTDLWICDPSRNGFPALFSKLIAHTGPKYILSFHCHQKGLLNDAHILQEASYSLLEWLSVDIFPGSPHHEVICLWKRPYDN